MFTAKARKAARKKVKCQYCAKLVFICGIKAHAENCLKNPAVEAQRRKTCPVCEEFFYRNTETCSTSCSNTKFRSGENNPNYKFGISTYTKICFDTYGKKCAVCEELNVVDAHHLNGNRKDNKKENLIPLCPTHHRYLHSEFRYLIEEKIQEFLDRNRV